MKKMSLFLILSISFPGFAQMREQGVQGTASAEGKVVYIEKHRVTRNSEGKLLTAETRYESPGGNLLAVLKSDFTKSVTVPDHVVEDFRTGDIEGLRRENGKIILFDKQKGKPERSRILDEADAENRILVGCQGLNYYLLGRLDPTQPPIEHLPLRFLIPGKLDYYDFDMKELPQADPKLALFEIKVKSIFLRLFAPKLLAKYDRKTSRLVWYQGLSNIKSDAGELQNVTIEYSYAETDKKNENL